MIYRADINGLRAVSVISVLAFHGNVGGFGGGYVGVDVFFVISGYLISSIIFGQVDAGRFSIADFYVRRIRRIVPALSAMILATMLAAFVLFYPVEIIEVAKSAIASVFSLSNFYFWSTADYFDAPAITKPLLHTWSLGVEEQFYIFFPMFAVLLGRFRPARRALAVSLVLLISFAISAWLAYDSPTSAFYLPQSRVWELLVGSLLATGVVPAPRLRLVRELLAAAGLLAILFAVRRFDNATPFPGFAALLPCIGGAAVILAGAGGTSLTARLLSTPPMVFVGLISYSLYLWHWPLIVFQRLDQVIHTGLPMVVDRLLLVGLMFGLATLSWWFIERPFRQASRQNRVRLVVTPLAASVLLVLFSTGVVLADGVPQRFSPAAIRLAAFLGYDPDPDMRSRVCFLYNKSRFSDFDPNLCMHRAPGQKAFLLFGDSHAGHLYPGLEAVFGRQDAILQATATGCKPLVTDISDATACTRLVKWVFEDYLAHNHVDLLIISARWHKSDLAGLAPTLDWLKQHDIRAVVIGPTPEYDIRLPGLLARSADRRDYAGLAAHIDPEFGPLDRQMAQIVAGRPDVTYVSPYQCLCGEESCAFFAGDEPLFYDRGHLTRAGSVMLVERLRNALVQ